MPDNNYCIPPAATADKYGQFMCEVLDEWTQDDDPNIRVTFIASTLGLFFGNKALICGTGPSDGNEIPLITIASNGDLSPLDQLRSTDLTIMNTANVAKTSLKEFLSQPIFQEIAEAQRNLPQVCQACCWEKICGAGGIVNRFSQEKRFNNPSIYCEGLKDFYAALVAYMIKNNFPVKEIKHTLLV